jgi:hypothetical protein
VVCRREFKLEVYPIVLVSCHWPGASELSPLISDFPDKRVLFFDFEIVVLEQMMALQHARNANPAALALSGGMRVGQNERARLAVMFLESLAAVNLSEEEREIVTEFFFGHLRLDHDEKLQLKEELTKVGGMSSEEIRELVKISHNPFVEWGREEGMEKGREEGRLREAELVLRLLRRKFGVLAAEQADSIRKLSIEKLEALAEALLYFQCIGDLDAWLAS